MNNKIPDFLIKMSKQLNEQNNRMTADPMFEVRYKTSLVTECGYNESHWEIFCDSGHTLYHSEKSENLDDLASYLFQNESDWCKEWICENDLTDVELDEFAFIELFNEHFDIDYNADELPDDVKKLHMQEIEVTVSSHFTEADAQAFINRKQNDYPKLYIYATSLYFCESMKKLRSWIKDLTIDNEK